MSPTKRNLVFGSFVTLFISGLVSLGYSFIKRGDASLNLTLEEFDHCRLCWEQIAADYFWFDVFGFAAFFGSLIGALLFGLLTDPKNKSHAKRADV
ncbi:hypothetical protein [Azotobacter vinelandii]